MKYWTPDKLLTFPPDRALLIATNDALGTSLHPDYVVVGEVYDVQGNLAKVDITSRTVEPNSLEQRFANKGFVTIDRMDISDFFDGSFTIEYSGVISSKDVARIISDSTGIIFDDRDFTETLITPQSNKLVVSPRSLRWMGELTIAPA